MTLHVVEVVNNANKVLGLIKRTIGSVNKEIFSTLYKALVRPILEYASPVWCPYLVKNIVLLEKVQRRASRLALGQRRGEMSYEDRCEMLRWSQLTDRRLYFSLIECYKLVFGLNSLCFCDFFEHVVRAANIERFNSRQLAAVFVYWHAIDLVLIPIWFLICLT